MLPISSNDSRESISLEARRAKLRERIARPPKIPFTSKLRLFLMTTLAAAACFVASIVRRSFAKLCRQSRTILAPFFASSFPAPESPFEDWLAQQIREARLAKPRDRRQFSDAERLLVQLFDIWLATTSAEVPGDSADEVRAATNDETKVD